MAATEVVTQQELAQWKADEAAQAYDTPQVRETTGTDITADNGRIFVQRAQDVEPILNRAKELAANGQAWSPSGELLHLAEFPTVVVETYCNTKQITFREFMQDPQHVKNMLADPALRDFKVWDNVAHKTWR